MSRSKTSADQASSPQPGHSNAPGASPAGSGAPGYGDVNQVPSAMNPATATPGMDPRDPRAGMPEAGKSAASATPFQPSLEPSKFQQENLAPNAPQGAPGPGPNDAGRRHQDAVQRAVEQQGGEHSEESAAGQRKAGAMKEIPPARALTNIVVSDPGDPHSRKEIMAGQPLDDKYIIADPHLTEGTHYTRGETPEMKKAAARKVTTFDGKAGRTAKTHIMGMKDGQRHEYKPGDVIPEDQLDAAHVEGRDYE